MVLENRLQLLLLSVSQLVVDGTERAVATAMATMTAVSLRSVRSWLLHVGLRARKSDSDDTYSGDD